MDLIQVRQFINSKYIVKKCQINEDFEKFQEKNLGKVLRSIVFDKQRNYLQIQIVDNLDKIDKLNIFLN